MTEIIKPTRSLKTRVAFAWRILREPALELKSLESLTPRTAEESPVLAGQLSAEQLDLKKVEYSGTAERYENIYKAIWQNFSYMAAVSAGILTFGAKQLPMGVLVWLALFPLVFWSVATFVPLDFYGREARSHLRRIEGSLNGFYFSGNLNQHRLSHFADFDKAEPPWHVRTIVRGFALVISGFWIALTVWIVVFIINSHPTWGSAFHSLSQVSGESHGASVKIETNAP